MVEMRWIMVSAGAGRGLLGGSQGQMYETVLQYREGAYDVIRRDTGEALWCGSDWTDVKKPSPFGDNGSTK